jgi:hypothetical protein
VKAYWGSGGITPHILGLVRFTPRKRSPGTHSIGGWVGPRAGLDAVVKRKIPSPCRYSNPSLRIGHDHLPHPFRSPDAIFMPFGLNPLVRHKIKSPCLTKQHALKTYWGSGDKTACIIDVDTRWRWVVSFAPWSLYPREKAPGTSWTGGWVGPRAGPDAVVRRKIPNPSRDSNPPIIQPVAQHCTTELSWLVMVGWTYISAERNMKHLQNFGWRASWKATAWTTRLDMSGQC